MYIRLFREDRDAVPSTGPAELSDPATGLVTAVIQRIPQEFIDGDCPDYNQSKAMEEMRGQERAAAQLVRRAILLNAGFATEGSALLQLRELLASLAPLHDTLFWTTATPSDTDLKGGLQRLPISFVEVPGLSLSFDVHQVGKGSDVVIEVRSVERAGYVVRDMASFESGRQAVLRKYLEGVQEYLVLENKEGAVEILVPHRTAIVRQTITGSPYHADYLPVYACAERCRSYYVYSVHASGAYLVIPSLMARLYLIYLRLSAYRYEDASSLIDGLFLESEPLSNAQSSLVESIVNLSKPRTAEAILCQLKFLWRLTDNKGTRDGYETAIQKIYRRFLSVRNTVAHSLLPTQSMEKSIIEKMKVGTSIEHSTVESMRLGTMLRVGSAIRLRSMSAAGLVNKIAGDFELRKQLLDSLQPGGSSPKWKPMLRWKEANVGHDKLEVSWEVAVEGVAGFASGSTKSLVKSSKSSAGSDFLRSVVYYVLVYSCAAPETKEGEGEEKLSGEKEKEKHNELKKKLAKAMTAGTAKYVVGQWVRDRKTTGLVGVISRVIAPSSSVLGFGLTKKATEGSGYKYEVHFPGVVVGATQSKEQTSARSVVVEEDLQLWEVHTALMLGKATSKGSLEDLHPDTEYQVQLFAMTRAGLRSEVDVHFIRTKVAPKEVRGMEEGRAVN